MSDRPGVPARTALVTREHAYMAARNAVRNQGYAVAKHGRRTEAQAVSLGHDDART